MKKFFEQGLPDVPLPMIGKVTGGTRLIMVSGGPGKAVTVERTTGELMERRSGEDVPTTFDWVPNQLTKDLEIYLSTKSRFGGAELDPTPHVFHDGTPKARNSYRVFGETATYDYVDAMATAPSFISSPHYFWTHGMNATNTKKIKTVLVFCSLKTIRAVLCQLDLIQEDARILVPSAGMVTVNVPIGAPASWCIAHGPFDRGAYRWGTVTNEEYDKIHEGTSPRKVARC